MWTLISHSKILLIEILTLIRFRMRIVHFKIYCSKSQYDRNAQSLTVCQLLTLTLFHNIFHLKGFFT